MMMICGSEDERRGMVEGHRGEVHDPADRLREMDDEAGEVLRELIDAGAFDCNRA